MMVEAALGLMRMDNCASHIDRVDRAQLDFVRSTSHDQRTQLGGKPNDVTIGFWVDVWIREGGMQQKHLDVDASNILISLHTYGCPVQSCIVTIVV
jgi:hypothetical protein